jgi:hypothetical protein
MNKLLDEFYRYFHDTVLLTYVDYINGMRKKVSGRNKDIRKVASIVSVFYHLRERLPEGFAVSRGDLEKINNDFEILADINNVIKHGKIDIKRRPNAKVLVSSDVFERNEVTLYEDEEGEYSNVRNKVIVRLHDNSERDVEDIITSVMNMWIKYLIEKNLIRPINGFSINDNSEPVLRDNAGGIDFMASGGVLFNSSMVLMKYNYQKKTSEIVDTSGSEIKMRIYKPVPIFTRVKLTDTQTDTERLLVLSLNETELVQLKGKISNSLDVAVLQKILSKRKVLCLSKKGQNGPTIEIPLTEEDFNLYVSLNKDEIDNFLKPFLDTAFMSEQDVSDELLVFGCC